MAALLCSVYEFVCVGYIEVRKLVTVTILFWVAVGRPCWELTWPSAGIYIHKTFSSGGVSEHLDITRWTYGLSRTERQKWRICQRWGWGPGDLDWTQWWETKYGTCEGENHDQYPHDSSPSQRFQKRSLATCPLQCVTMHVTVTPSQIVIVRSLNLTLLRVRWVQIDLVNHMKDIHLIQGVQQGCGS